MLNITDWSNINVKWEDGTNGIQVPYVMVRGAKGRFAKHYLTDEEQNAYKQHVSSKQLSEAVNGGVRPTWQQVAGGPGGSAGDPGEEGVDGFNGKHPLMPQPLLIDEDYISFGPAVRLARHSTTLVYSTQRLTEALYAFGVIYERDFAGLIVEAASLEHIQEDNHDTPCSEVYAQFRAFACMLHAAWTSERSASPVRVIGMYAAPTIHILQYVLGMAAPHTDLMQKANEGHLLHRTGPSEVSMLGQELLAVYNMVQTNLTTIGYNLVGATIDEIGGELDFPDGASLIDYVNGVDQLFENLVKRVDMLSDHLEQLL